MKSMIFVEQNARTVPVSEVFACYFYGPIDRDVDDYGSLSYDEATKHHVVDQLKKCLHDLRNISGGTYIDSIDHGLVTDQILTSSVNKGPFDSEESFSNTLIDVYQANAPKRHVRSLLTGMLSQNKHWTVFTHDDLRLQNIMIKSEGLQVYSTGNSAAGTLSTESFQKHSMFESDRTIELTI
ncbi:hypothetical protein AJ78_08143 [Emergomyces pasteurianus Ep9510]|uniref:Aminoglycoside phosphotransferase domain-containing protein n=1 Tax=Emergomyces pasteurianus Ep9510 TaxID=1447872 RepID=A0A1J9Q4Z4_9EURO|nr:hypothetical protein AJ78_08143 [Emergomyces pasteurianus Ep9510]